MGFERRLLKRLNLQGTLRDFSPHNHFKIVYVGGARERAQPLNQLDRPGISLFHQ